MSEQKTNELAEKKQDADSLIKEVLQKIPEGKKIEVLRILDGFALATESSEKTSPGR